MCDAEQALGYPGEVWPKDDWTGSGAKPEALAPYTSRTGPANAMDGLKSSEDAAIPDVLPLEESRTAKTFKSETGITLFETVDVVPGKPEPKKYYVMFRFNTMDPSVPSDPKSDKVKKVVRSKHIEVFNDANPLPATGISLAALTADTSVVQNRQDAGYRFVPGSNRERGVYAVYQNAQLSSSAQRDVKANCAGPIIWWGLADRAAALAACEKEAF